MSPLQIRVDAHQVRWRMETMDLLSIVRLSAPLCVCVSVAACQCILAYPIVVSLLRQLNQTVRSLVDRDSNNSPTCATTFGNSASTTGGNGGDRRARNSAANASVHSHNRH